MSKLDALKELAAKVEAGPYLTGADTKACMAAFPDGAGVRGSAAGNACAAWNGSLDAAKALHEAVLPGWTMDQFGQRAGGWIAVLGCRDGKTPQPAPQAMVRDNPARAWLLAILRALIAQEEKA